MRNAIPHSTCGEGDREHVHNYKEKYVLSVVCLNCSLRSEQKEFKTGLVNRKLIGILSKPGIGKMLDVLITHLCYSP